MEAMKPLAIVTVPAVPAKMAGRLGAMGWAPLPLPAALVQLVVAPSHAPLPPLPWATCWGVTFAPFQYWAVAAVTARFT